MPKVVDNMVSLRFSDGEFMVPFWWAQLEDFRQGPEHGNRAPALKFTYAEAQGRANASLDRAATRRIMGDWMARAR